MRNKVNKLFEAITPFRLCFDLGLKTHEYKNGWYSIRDPDSNKNFIYLNDSEFVGSDYNSEFYSGNIVDFIVHYKNLNYVEAVQYLIDVYSSRLNTPILGSIKWSALGIAAYLDKLNNLTKTFESYSNALLKKSKFSKLRSYLNQYDSDEMIYGRLLGAASGKDLAVLTADLASCQHIKIKALAVNESSNYLVVPFFANHHLISKLNIINPDTKSVRELTVVPYRHHIFGLRNLKPGDTCVNVAPSVDDVLNLGKKYFLHAHGDQQCCISLNYKDSGKLDAPRIPKGLLPIDENSNWLSIFKSQECFDKLRLVNKNQIFSAGFSRAVDSREYLLDLFLQVLNVEGFESENLYKFLRTISVDETLLSLIKTYLKNNNKHMTLAKLDTFFTGKEVLKVRGAAISTTNEGYVAYDSVTSESTQFTNFCIKLDHTIIFRGSGDTYHRGNVLVSGMSFPICMSKRETQRQNDIVSAAVSAITTSQEIDNEDLKVPTLLDNTYGGILKNILNSEIDNCKLQLGVRTLGWDPTKERYQGTSWYVSNTGLREQHPFPHPGIKNLMYFDFGDASVPSGSSYINNSVSNVLFALVSAFLCRSYLGLPCPPVKILNTTANQVILKAVLKNFRQTRFLELNSNQRSRIKLFDGLDGFPVICLNPSEPVSRTMDYPAFILGKEGSDFRYSINEEQLEKIEQFSEFLFPFLIKEILKHRGGFFRNTNNSPSFDDLLYEGTAVLRMLYPEVKWSTANLKFPILNAWLSEMNSYDLPSVIKVSEDGKKTILNTRGQGFKREALLRELTNNGIQAALPYSPNRRYQFHIICETEPILQILNSFYFSEQTLGKMEDTEMLKKHHWNKKAKV